MLPEREACWKPCDRILCQAQRSNVMVGTLPSVFELQHRVLFAHKIHSRPQHVIKQCPRDINGKQLIVILECVSLAGTGSKISCVDVKENEITKIGMLVYCWFIQLYPSYLFSLTQAVRVITFLIIIHKVKRITQSPLAISQFCSCNSKISLFFLLLPLMWLHCQANTNQGISLLYLYTVKDDLHLPDLM